MTYLKEYCQGGCSAYISFDPDADEPSEGAPGDWMCDECAHEPEADLHPDIYGFKGEYRWLSNFYGMNLVINGLYYPSLEHAYQAAKCLNFKDAEAVRTAGTPGQAKRRGRKAELKPGFDEMKLVLMYRLLTVKFGSPANGMPANPLREKLFKTDDCHIEETNDWGDRYWGVCNGTGSNYLGKLIMKVREDMDPQLRSRFARKEG
jgi:ribA/ribD-fused uncharacterized protein